MFFIFHNNFVNNHCCWRHERCKSRGNSRSALELLLCLYCSRFRWFQARASCKFKRSYNLIVFFIFLSGHDRRSYWLSRGPKFATFSHMCTFEYNICLISSQITLKCEFRNVVVRRTDAKRRKETRQDRFMTPLPPSEGRYSQLHNKTRSMLNNTKEVDCHRYLAHNVRSIWNERSINVKKMQTRRTFECFQLSSSNMEWLPYWIYTISIMSLT